MTKTRQEQLDEAYGILIQVCLYDRQLADMEPYLAGDVMNFGAGRKEITRTKSAFLEQIKNQKELAAGLKMDFQFTPVLRKVINDGNGAIYSDDIVNTVWINGEATKLSFRLSFIFEYSGDKWMLVHSHTSAPDSQRTDDEVWPVEKLKKRTAILEKSLDEKIAELEIKNEQLKISAKESQIQLALEKVRARTMAMQRSEELQEAANLLFQQLKSLDMPAWSAGYCIWDEDKQGVTLWMSSEGVMQPSFHTPLTEDPSFIHMREAYERGDDFHMEEVGGDALVFHYQYMRKLPVVGEILDSIITAGHPLPAFQIFHCVYFSQGFLLFITYEPVAESHGVFKRFGNVFDQTYTRFLDLQKAESQAKEAQIEVALERTRTQSMLMQHSSQLDDTLRVFHEQVLLLGINSAFSFLWLPDEQNLRHIFWAAWAENLANGHRENSNTRTYNSKAINYPLDKNEPATAQCLLDWKSDIPVHAYRVPPAEVENYFAAWKELLDGVDNLKPEFFREGLYYVEAFMKYGCFGVMVEKELPEEEKKLLNRFAIEFERTYTRFLDLQKAEAQARESQIQLALERVRARTMAMQRSNELQDTALLLFQQILALGVSQFGCGFNIWDDDRKAFTSWMGGGLGENTFVPPFKVSSSDDIFLLIYKAAERGESLFVREQAGEELEMHYRYMNSMPVWKEIMEGITLPTFQVMHCAFFSQGFLMFISPQPIPDAHDIFIRFAKVFEQTYTRFLDLQKAEARVREAMIEAALEKVRSRSMGMQKSDELKEVIQVVYEQFVHLDIHIEHTGFVVNYMPKGDWHFWIADKNGVPSEVTVPYFDSVWGICFNEAKEKGLEIFTTHLGFEEKNEFYRELLAFIPGLPEDAKTFYFSCPGLAISTVLQENVSLYIENFSGTPYTNEEHAVLMRFGRVFQQTYTRFLDLQKAEAQAREAQIEAALERVRSRAMAMQKTEELLEAAELVGTELSGLGINSMNVSYAFVHENEKEASYYSVNPLDGKILPFAFAFPHTETEVMRTILASWKRQEPFNVMELDEASTLKHQTWAGGYIQYIFELKGIPFSMEEFLKISPKKAVIYTFNFANGYLFNIGSVRLTAAQEDIALRITKVFDLTYRRFLDLKQAESQAREAQIEAALERVRSRTMAMQHSDELLEVASIVFQQVKALGVPQYVCGVNIWNEGDTEFTYYPGTSDNKILPLPCKIPLMEHPVFRRFHESRMRGDDLFIYEKKGKEQTDHYQYMLSLPVLGDLLRSWVDAGLQFPVFQIDHLANFAFGNLLFITYEHCPQMHDVFRRFAKVFEQTYTRFLDLQKAEAQALETVKRASVDRVRAEIASMRTTSDLDRITPLIWNELTTLGVPFIRCGVFIMDEEEQQVNTYLSNPEGKAIAAFHQPYNSPGDIGEVVKCWRKKEMYTRHWDEAMFVEVTKHLVQQGGITSGEKYLTENHPTDLYLHFLPFLQGMLYAGNTAPLSNDALQLVQNLADAFSTAYARYEDFNKLEAAKEQVDKTLTDLKQTQAQLVQAEKMASLGELTAGIAHEIQNPLNFVNNFSELSNELIDEMQVEMGKGNINEVKQLADDIRSNLEKINLHGKRADAIVKGMLQHSRTTSGEKLPTDLNALADEYLRLAYHGLRAKDKSFNATLVTDFDHGITRVNIIPQDIGRVMLNLISNAFYAVDEKKKSATENFEPTVSVMTKNVNGHIEIMVRDNGNGISKKVMEKIFQPFFTTKPTGQGTGLGLSLAYDIVKAHGGEIKVETKEREGSCFTISIPNN